MSDEFNIERAPEITPEPEPIKRSKLKRIKSTAIDVGVFYLFPVTMVGGLMFFGYKISKMDLEAARLNLEAAKLQDLADAATQQ